MKEEKGSEYHILIRDKYHISTDVDAESISNFVGDRINIRIPIKRSMIGSYIMLIVIFAVIALLVKPIINSLDFWLRLVQSKYIWAFISGAIYTCSLIRLNDCSLINIIYGNSKYLLCPSAN